MQIIDATVTNARRLRDWGRVEARATLTYRVHPGGPVETRRVLISAPEGYRRGGGLRPCLVADAVRLVRMTEQAPIALAEAA